MDDLKAVQAVQAIKFCEDSHDIDYGALILPHAVDRAHAPLSGVAHDSLMPYLIRAVQHLSTREDPLRKETDSLRRQVTALANKIQALEHGLSEVHERPAPPAPAPVNVTTVSPAHEMRLHFKGETEVQISSQTPDGVRVVKLLLE